MTWLAIGLGGFLGAILRYGLSAAAQHLAPGDFPLGTLVVNVLGCVAIGALAWFVLEREIVSDEARAFLQIGMLGSLTTFSTFGLETFSLLRAGEHLVAVASVASNLLLSLGGVWVGWVAARSLGT